MESGEWLARGGGAVLLELGPEFRDADHTRNPLHPLLHQLVLPTDARCQVSYLHRPPPLLTITPLHSLSDDSMNAAA